MTSHSPLVMLALVTIATPAFADEAIVASANGNTVVVSSGTPSAPAPATTVAYAEPVEPAMAPEASNVTIVTAPPRSRNTLGVDALAVVPVGNYANAVDIGLGAGLRLEVPAGRGFITGRVGALFHAIDGSAGDHLTIVPIYGGYRHPIGSGNAYIAGEIGLTLAWATVDTAFGRVSASDSDLGALLSAGTRLGALDLRAGLFTPDLDDAFGLIATAGYDFASL